MKRLAVLVLVSLLCVLSAVPALAASQTWTVTTKVTVPVFGTTMMGTFVINDVSSGTATWSFDGQVGGKQATASGLASVTYSANGYQGNITRVTSWNVPGFKSPALPIPFSVTQGSGKTVVGSATVVRQGVPVTITAPLSYQGIDQLPDPSAGNLNFSVTNASGAPVTTLPKTGVEPAAMSYLAAALVALGALGLVASRRILQKAA